MKPPWIFWRWWCAPAWLLVMGIVLRAEAGGGPENVLLVIDPTSVDSTYVGHYYKQARGIPDRNVLYMEPTTATYQDFVAFQLDAVLGTIEQRGIADSIDYVVIPPGGGYRTEAEGLAADLCSPVRNFAVTMPYVGAFLSDVILAGTSSTRPNRYYAFFDNEPVGFDGSVEWFDGQPSDAGNAQRYFISFLLGYSGPRGNTVVETIAMIDRSVAVDGTRPAGTFYYMETTDETRSGPRDGFYPQGVSILDGLGATGAHLFDVLPEGQHDCLGVMTGWASPQIVAADMTILPGAFCDHLTSFAGFFDTSSQTKVSEWIAKGASGSVGAVEEPCNFATKFPHPRLHIYYSQGASLGEATFRSLANVPFQMLMYGDPLTQPFAFVPTVDVPDAPTGVVSGMVTLTPTASSTRPGGSIDRVELFVDGVSTDTRLPSETFEIDTTELADGWHELRVVAFDAAAVATQGRWVGEMMVNNAGRSVTLATNAMKVSLDSLFAVTVSANGGDVREIRVMQHGRVIASTSQNQDTLMIHARQLGAGPSRLQAEVDFVDGARAVSSPMVMDVSPDDVTPPVNTVGPLAYSYRMRLSTLSPVLLDLPVTDVDGDVLSIEIVDLPTQATVQEAARAFLLQPDSGATGFDSLSFRASDGTSVSATATVTIQYPGGVCEPASLVMTVELEALTNGVGREVEYQLGRCDESVLLSGEEVVAFGTDGIGTLTVDSVPADVAWVRVVEGHTMPVTKQVSMSVCGPTFAAFTGPNRLPVGDLQSDTILKDGVVDVGDFAILSAGWLESVDPTSSMGADVNGDGVQDDLDFTAMISNYSGIADLGDGCDPE